MKSIKFTNIYTKVLFLLTVISGCKSSVPSYKILHNTEYIYSKPVFLSDHIVRLHTFKNDERVISCDLVINSKDCIVGIDFDKYNQQIWSIIFPTKLDHLKLNICLVLDTAKLFNEPNIYSLSNYKDFPGSFLQIDSFDAAMNLFLKINPLDRKASEIELLCACTKVFQEIEYSIHEEAGIYSPGELLKRGIGSCRDMNWFLVQYLRSQQIQARVVSGYLINWETKTVDYHLWAEAKSDEGKWVGLDATNGSFISQFHIPLCIGENPNEVALLEGSSEPCEVELNYEMIMVKN